MDEEQDVMRVAVVGASGNIGTALLRALRDTPTEVTALCRRPPDPDPPYDRARWVPVDLSRAGARTELTEAFADVDAVVHLAWAIQPVRNERAMYAVNVDGTRAVLAAAGSAGVKHVVHASSLGAYAPGPGPVSEDWPTTGIRSSAYSRHKAAAERIVDRFQESNPDAVISRVRPTLVAQATAAAEIAALFLGPLAPAPVIGLGRRAAGLVGRLPLPRGLALQFVHADDVAAAIVTILQRRIPGAFNLAAEPLDTAGLAALVGAKPLDLPPALVRAVVRALFAVRAVPVSPGWFDLAMQAPLIDSDRARRELDWQPRHSSTSTANELITALAGRESGSSPALAPGGPYAGRRSSNRRVLNRV
jgi:nucleoside-diphosphate-sugar epimerase